jgi:hypothetical protein
LFLMLEQPYKAWRDWSVIGFSGQKKLVRV